MPTASINFYYDTTTEITTEYEDSFGIKLVGDEGYLRLNAFHNKIQYSLDNGMTWTDWPSISYVLHLYKGNTVNFRGDINTDLTSADYYSYDTTDQPLFYVLDDPELSSFNSYDSQWEHNVAFNIFGDIMSLIDKTNYKTNYTIPLNSQFNGYFVNSYIVDASKLILKATTLKQKCYCYMFYNCKYMTGAPKLPATTIPNGAYAKMFRHCDSLEVAPKLPATTLGIDCYYAMFSYCGSLLNSPQLVSTTLAQSCYAYMFDNCNSLLTAPQLPATTLAWGCYERMFNNCVSLTTAPALPATTLTQYCYWCMFEGCSSLTTAPYLPATTLVYYCYVKMFCDCTSLNKVRVAATTNYYPDKSQYTKSWLSDVAPTGTFYKASSTNWLIDSAHGIPLGWTVYDIETETPVEPATQYTISGIPLDSSLGYVAGTGSFDEGTNVTLTAYPTGYNVFDGWYSDSTATTLLSTDTSYTISNISSNVTIYAKFSSVSYTLQLSNTTGIIDVTGAGTYDAGASVTVYANVDDHYIFDGWYDTNNELVSDSINYSFTIESNLTLTAKAYSISRATINISVDSNTPWGTCEITDGTPVENNIYEIGTTIRIKATPTTGYSFAYWMVNGSKHSILDEINFVLTESITYNIVAVFSNEDKQTIYMNDYFTIEFPNSQNDSVSESRNARIYVTGSGDDIEIYYRYVYYDNTYSPWTYTELDCTETNINTNVANDTNNPAYYFVSTGTDNIKKLQLYIKPGDAILHIWSLASGVETKDGNTYATTFNTQLNVYGNIDSLYVNDFVLDSNTNKPYNTFTYANHTISNNNHIEIFMSPEAYGTQDIYDTTSDLHKKVNNVYCLYRSMIYDASCLYVPINSNSDYTDAFLNNIYMKLGPVFYYDPNNTSSGLFVRTFKGCTALTTTQEISAAFPQLYAYYQMFYNCTSLTSAPEILPAMVTRDSCYMEMFYGCTSLTVAPELPATTLDGPCYMGMFKGCTSLKTAPVLPATELGYNCYNEMFYGCTSLNYVKAMFKSLWGEQQDYESSVNNMLYNVQPTGTYVANKANDYLRFYSYFIPSGWKVEYE